MPPARTIIVDTNEMLCNIAALHAGQLEAAQAVLDSNSCMYTSELYDAEDKVAGWVPRDLTLLAGRALTPSERIRHQQAVRNLEADGLVFLEPRFIRLTNAGREYVANLKSQPGQMANTAKG